MPPSPAPPSPDPRDALEQALHQRAVSQGPAAAADLIAYFLPRLRRRLERAFPALRTDPDLEGCALHALLEYLRAPHKHRPERYTLRSRLWIAARGNALNLLERRCARQPELPLDAERVAGIPDDRMQQVMRGVEGPEGLPEGVSMEELWAQVHGSLRERDRPVLLLVLEETATLENCAAALGLDPGLEADRRAARQSRDRCHAALRRVRERYRDVRSS